MSAEIREEHDFTQSRPNPHPRRLVITGADGQVGRQLAARARGWDVVALDRRQLDITQPGAADELLKPGDVVINCAAYTAVDAAEADEARALAVNGAGPGLLAASCARKGAKLIHISTDYVFSGDAAAPYPVDAPTGPRTAYGRTKLAGERAVLAELPAAAVVRTAWVYTGVGADFVATMRRLAAEGRDPDVVDDQVGSPTYSRDLADGLLQLADRREYPQVLHLTNAGETSWYGLAREVFRDGGADPARVSPCSTAQFPRPAARPAYSVLSGAAWAAAGLTPLRPWRAALKEAMELG